MAARRLHLGRPEVATIIDMAYRGEKPGWRNQRLLALKLAARGSQIGDLCGRSRTTVFALVKPVREGGWRRLSSRW